MLAHRLLEHYRDLPQMMVVIHGNKIESGHGSEGTHTHEEADTPIPYQVLAPIAVSPNKEVCVWSQDTGIFKILMDKI